MVGIRMQIIWRRNDYLGRPKYIAPSGTSLVTIAPAPIITLFPILTPFRIIALLQIKQPDPIEISKPELGTSGISLFAESFASVPS